jgi:hydrogenase nickel incorporation protein HypA/HybF
MQMHELAICQALLVQVEAIAHGKQARVSEVRVGIGPLSGVEPGLLARAYPLVCAGTAAEGSRLAIENTQIFVRCRDCGAETTAAPNRLLCGSCGAWRTDILAGDEMLLLRVELQLEEAVRGGAHV